MATHSRTRKSTNFVGYYERSVYTTASRDKGLAANAGCQL